MLSLGLIFASSLATVIDVLYVVLFHIEEPLFGQRDKHCDLTSLPMCVSSIRILCIDIIACVTEEK